MSIKHLFYSIQNDKVQAHLTLKTNNSSRILQIDTDKYNAIIKDPTTLNAEIVGIRKVFINESGEKSVGIITNDEGYKIAGIMYQELTKQQPVPIHHYPLVNTVISDSWNSIILGEEQCSIRDIITDVFKESDFEDEKNKSFYAEIKKEVNEKANKPQKEIGFKSGDNVEKKIPKPLSDLSLLIGVSNGYDMDNKCTFYLIVKSIKNNGVQNAKPSFIVIDSFTIDTNLLYSLNHNIGKNQTNLVDIANEDIIPKFLKSLKEFIYLHIELSDSPILSKEEFPAAVLDLFNKNRSLQRLNLDRKQKDEVINLKKIAEDFYAAATKTIKLQSWSLIIDFLLHEQEKSIKSLITKEKFEQALIRKHSYVALLRFWPGMLKNILHSVIISKIKLMFTIKFDKNMKRRFIYLNLLG